jgi:hypothetical protein
MNKKLTIKEAIDKCAAKGLSEKAISTALWELYYAETIRFDQDGNPYLTSCGEPLDPETELNFED